ncbi:MAG: D-aminoacyl-tRNA deacylase [Armatimonadota bacterium]|nr:D-aminoacyl-tRNA deacylase [Armatimonadota bacterium]
MRAVVQRVSKGSVTIDGEEVARIGSGLVILLGVGKDDGSDDAKWLADKIANLRIMEDEQGKMNLSLLETGGEAIVVSQFTLYGDCRKGRRPGFDRAAPPDMADELYKRFVENLQEIGIRTQTGQFRAKMLVEIDNDGPVTLLLDTKQI